VTDGALLTEFAGECSQKHRQGNRKYDTILIVLPASEIVHSSMRYVKCSNAARCIARESGCAELPEYYARMILKHLEASTYRMMHKPQPLQAVSASHQVRHHLQPQ
jgi:hypothetical protein